MSERVFYYVFGCGLIITGIILLTTGGFQLPTRHPPNTLDFFGLPHLLFSLAPILAGSCLFRLGTDSSRRTQLLTKLLFIAGILAMCSALILAQKNL